MLFILLFNFRNHNSSYFDFERKHLDNPPSPLEQFPFPFGSQKLFDICCSVDALHFCPTRYGLKFIMNYKYFPIQNSETKTEVLQTKSFGGWDIFVHDPDEDW